MTDIKEDLLLWFTNVLIKSQQVAVLIMRLNKISNWLKNHTNQSLEDLKKEQFILDSKTIQGVDLSDMQIIIKFNKIFRFLLYVIDIFSKFSWVIRLKDKKGVTIVNEFQKVLDKSGRKPNKI